MFFCNNNFFRHIYNYNNWTGTVKDNLIKFNLILRKIFIYSPLVIPPSFGSILLPEGAGLNHSLLKNVRPSLE